MPIHKTDKKLLKKDMYMPKNRIKIGFILIDGFPLLSYSSAIEPLRACNLLSGEGLFEIQHFSLGDSFASSSSGAKVPTQNYRHAEGIHFLFLVAGGDPFDFDEPDFFEWLNKLAISKTILGGISGGPVILTNAGLMKDFRMTVHWEHAALLEQIHPHLILERSLFVIDRNRITCSGGTAPLDLMHLLIAREFGTKFAREVSDWFIHTDVRKPGEAQRSGLEERYGTLVRPVLSSIELIENHIADPLSLEQIAKLVGMSTRHLNRLFQREMGTTVMQFCRKARLDVARKLIESSSLTNNEILQATGFSSPGQFSRCFREQFGLPPTTYRKEIKASP